MIDAIVEGTGRERETVADPADSIQLSWIEGGGITSAQGFLASGVRCGLKRTKLDLALLSATDAVPVAGVFTRNRVQAAPVVYCKERLAQSALCRAVVINSGNANACTGEPGMADTREMASLVARSLSDGTSADEVLVCSTGVIGQRLAMESLRTGVPRAVDRLSNSRSAGLAAAQAILTTDTTEKAFALEVELSGGSVRVGGMAKGSGMIAPDLELPPHATTLGFLTTDAVLAPNQAPELLLTAMQDSFNAITVDGDTSTNDTVLLMASGAAGVAAQSAEDVALLQGAIAAVAQRLAIAVVRDGEGANRVIEIRVVGAQDAEQAVATARSVANSPLVKTAFHAGEPNWGRLLMAVGKADQRLDPDRVSITVGGLRVVERGMGTAHESAELTRRMTTDDVLVEIDLGFGSADSRVWTCDLSAEYVHINASYMS